MLDIPRFCIHAASRSGVVRGSSLHRAALEAAHHGCYEKARELFEAAAQCYRRELAVEPLARLRVHELMTRVKACSAPDREPESCIEVERRLYNLQRIESLEPPFELVNAHSLLASWLRHEPSFQAEGEVVTITDLERAA
jgi:hypothetical protein